MECAEGETRVNSRQEKIYKFCLFRTEGPDLCEGSPIPKARSGHRIASYNGKIYSFGGFNPKILEEDEEMLEDPFWNESRPLFKELWEYNLSSCTWRKIDVKGTIPNQLASHTAIFHPSQSGRLLVYGGTGNPFGSVTSSAIHVCDVNTGIFTKLNTASSTGDPMALYGQSITIDETGCLYTVGGTTGFQYFMDVNVIDLNSCEPSWQRLNSTADPSEPFPRYRHEIAVYKGKIYLLGGGTSTSVCGFQTIPTFSIDENFWYATKTSHDRNVTIDEGDGNGYPDARRCHGLVQSGNQVWIVGGYDGQDIFNDIWNLDLANFSWKKIDLDLPKPVYFHGVTLTEEGRLVVFGGVDCIQNNTRTNDIYSFWLKVPSLRSMAWEAVKFYIPKINRLPKGKLREIGVPMDYIATLSGGQALCG
eukprot:TRINITY_DN3145_c0_g2_i14.p1 TRINITY_DN3145_c0_g2~~TRINITY_DN3145_c0_g2_i14.p1  ORF type:complete len:419 (-),score=42.95 TRINITY_DN3145_c0_g2_i14:221-1477(-)